MIKPYCTENTTKNFQLGDTVLHVSSMKTLMTVTKITEDCIECTWLRVSIDGIPVLQSVTFKPQLLVHQMFVPLIKMKNHKLCLN